MQAVGEGTAQGPRDRSTAVIDRASKEPDLDGAGLILSSLLSDESALRSAFSTPAALDERSIYILFGGAWGSRAEVAWRDRLAWQRIRTGAVSAKPELIRPVLRADRYASYFERRHPRGAATINSFPVFAGASSADDLLEGLIEPMRRDATRPAAAIRSPYNDSVLVKAEEMEVHLLASWQVLCGVCGRPDLIAGSTAGNWRGRFPELDEWFRRNRPYIVWDDGRSHIRIDGAAREEARPTPRSSRSIPELKPPWLLVEPDPPALH
jgi:hypothetical protein